MITIHTIPVQNALWDDELLSLYYSNLSTHWSKSKIRQANAIHALLGNPPRKEARLVQPWLNLNHYVTMQKRRAFHRIINPGAIPLATSVLKNKKLFYSLMQSKGIQVPKTISDPNREAIAHLLEQSNLIIEKPNFSSKGKNVVRYHNMHLGWKDTGHKTFSVHQLQEKLSRTIADGGIVQEAIETHKTLSEISPDALPTLRVVTIRYGSKIEVGATILRCGRGGVAVDNFNSGGIIANVNDDGSLGPAFLSSKTEGARICERHPLTKKSLAISIESKLFDQAKHMAQEAHHVIEAGYNLIGWDIGLGRNGPIVIEGNWNSGADIIQLSQQCPLSRSSLGHHYLNLLKNAEDSRWVQARPIEIDWK